VRNFSPTSRCPRFVAGQEDLLALPLVELLDELAERDGLVAVLERAEKFQIRTPTMTRTIQNSKLFRVEFKPGLLRASFKSTRLSYRRTRASRARACPATEIRSWPPRPAERYPAPSRPPSGPEQILELLVSPQAHRRPAGRPDAGSGPNNSVPTGASATARSAAAGHRPEPVAPGWGDRDGPGRPPGSVSGARPGRASAPGSGRPGPTRPPSSCGCEAWTRARPRSRPHPGPAGAGRAGVAAGHTASTRHVARADGPPRTTLRVRR